MTEIGIKVKLLNEFKETNFAEFTTRYGEKEGYFFAAALPREKRIGELLEENARLKTRIRKQSDELYNRYAETEFYKENNQRHYEQFLKAKEIIEALYDSIPASMTDYCKDAIDKAKSFFEELE